MLSATFYWKEGAPTWVGTAAFSSKKETLKHFRLEVRPFLGIALSVCCAASSPKGEKMEFAQCQGLSYQERCHRR